MIPKIPARLIGIVSLGFMIWLTGCATQMPSVGKMMRPGDVTLNASFTLLRDAVKKKQTVATECYDTEPLYEPVCDSSNILTTDPFMYSLIANYWGNDQFRAGLEMGLFVQPNFVVAGRWRNYGLMGWINHPLHVDSISKFGGGIATAQALFSSDVLQSGVYEFWAFQRRESIMNNGLMSLSIVANPSYQEIGAGAWMNIGRLQGQSLDVRVGYDLTDGRWQGYFTCSFDFGFKL